jgi:CDP-glucose 4,6-dehydratase
MLNGKIGKVNKFQNIYKGKKVLLTGDTGFKGSWLSNWLLNLGAEVIGYSLKPNSIPSHFEILNLSYQTYDSDICDLESLIKIIKIHKPDIIFHLAAQSLVRYSYDNPLETYRTNVIGTANILEASKCCENIKAVVVITTDKCYENLEQTKGYIETDRMGGFDPYSSSKGCAELLVNSYRNSYFNLNDYNIRHQLLIATARAGNVIGGGDWSKDRLIPDLIRGAINNKTTLIRSPYSTRPWQHVLEPLSGYLLLGMNLLQGKSAFAESWNFGPEENQVLSVEDVLALSKKIWKNINYSIFYDENNYHEAALLSLNIDKAKSKLNWLPRWENSVAIEKTINWYRVFYENKTIHTQEDINEYSKKI